MKIRATNPNEKEQRREAILDAAEQLWLQDPVRMANVADIAKAAGLAKGTVYLYFRSKEELLLSVHERHVHTFFDRISERAVQTSAMSLDDLFAINQQFLQDSPAFLSLATLCHGLMERQIPVEVAFAFEEALYQHLDDVVSQLQRHFPQASAELMLQSYGLILGLWQLLRPTPLKALLEERDLPRACRNDYLAMLEPAMSALWRGAATSESSS